MSQHAEWAVTGCLCLAVLCILKTILRSQKRYNLPLPPFVPLSEEEIYKTPVESMVKALRQNGSIVQICRDGKKEYIASNEHTRQILTDESKFSFESGMAELLGLNWILNLHQGTFFQDMDSVVREFLTRRLDRIMPKLWPIFERGASNLSDAAKNGEPVDMLPYLESTMAEVTINIFLSQKYDSSEYMKSVIDVAKDIAELLGLSHHNKPAVARRLPRVWRFFLWLKIILVRIPFHLGRKFARDLWGDISSQESLQKSGDDNLISFLVRRYISKEGHLSYMSRMWIMVLTVTIFFGSVHQTVTIMVWVTYYLALRPDSQNSLRGEINTIVGHSNNEDSASVLDYSGLQKAVLTDSFVREVLRMKGDSVNVVRSSVRDVELGGYTIPKGSLIFPVTFLAYRSSEFLPDPDNFRATRWVGSGKTAGTVGPGYLAFGLGRWSCPGRFLAVMEVKSWVLALVKNSTFELENHEFKVMDAYNITAVPPQGRLFFEKQSGRE